VASSERSRLDVALVERGLAETRSRAQALVMAGRVTVDGAVVDKAGAAVSNGSAIEVERPARYVSRGGDKLETAIVRWGINLAGERCLDLGASTGGFTDCLLQHGAAEVVALDVGRGQLHERLRGDPRVHSLERVNARELTPEMLPYAPGVITACAASMWRAVVLVKPQFEAGRAQVRGGVVRDPAVRAQVLHDLADFVTGRGVTILGVCDSSHPGPAGNREYLMYLASPGHPAYQEREIDVSAEITDAVGEVG